MSTQICRHIRSDGSRCGCLALSGQTLCYYHVRLGKLHRNIAPEPDPIPTIIHPITTADGMQRDPVCATYPKAALGPLLLDIPPLEDRESIQLALSMVITAMAQDRIDIKRATSIVYALQVASSNARNLRVSPARSNTVTETVLDENGQQIAPDEDPESEIISKHLLELIEQEDAEEAALLAEEEEDERYQQEWEEQQAAKREEREKERCKSQFLPTNLTTLHGPSSSV